MSWTRKLTHDTVSTDTLTHEVDKEADTLTHEMDKEADTLPVSWSCDSPEVHLQVPLRAAQHLSHGVHEGDAAAGGEVVRAFHYEVTTRDFLKNLNITPIKFQEMHC